MTANLETRLRRFDADVRPPVLPDTDVSYHWHDTPVGRLALVASDRGLLACSYASPDDVLDIVARVVSPKILRSAARFDQTRREFDEYFAGRRTRFDTRIDLALTGDFQRAVLRSLKKVSFGKTTTYSELAHKIGHPRAQRAVGTALGRNPVCIILPCHRVVPASGGIGNYGGGSEVKRFLLDLEGASTPAQRQWRDNAPRRGDATESRRDRPPRA